MVCFGYLKQVHPGEIYLKGMVIGKMFIADFLVGQKQAFLTEFFEFYLMEAIAVIPPKSNRKEQRDFDRHYYKDRNLIERFFCRLKQFRGIATRYCKRGQYFLETIKLAASIILMY